MRSHKRELQVQRKAVQMEAMVAMGEVVRSHKRELQVKLHHERQLQVELQVEKDEMAAVRTLEGALGILESLDLGAGAGASPEELGEAARRARELERRLSDAARDAERIAERAAVAKEEEWECPICIESGKVQTAFGCGHRTCSECSEQVSQCPICREPVTNRVRLY